MNHNLTFAEYLQYRDPVLYDELLNEVNLKQLGLSALTTLGLMGNPYNTQAGTPTELKQRQDYNNALQRPQDSRTEKELYKRMFTQGLNIDDFSSEVKRSRHDREGKIFAQTDQLDLPTGMRRNVPSEHGEEYKENDILFKKVINPYDYIRSGQQDKEKFDRDYQKLGLDNPNDKGFTTFKHKFNNQVLMYIVKEKAIEKVMPDTEGYHTITTNPETGERIAMIVLPDTAFKRLPSGNDPGELTEDGKRLLAHELRHATQRFENVPEDRGQTEKSDIDHYMHDPVEMGVRLAATKNFMSPETILRLTNNDPKHQAAAQEILKKAGGSEKELMKMIMNPEGTYANTLHFIRDRLKVINKDVGTLFLFYDYLKGQRKANFMQELLDNYDNVVKNDTKTPNTNPIT